MISSNEQEWESAKRQQQGYKIRGLLKHEQEEITPSEASARMRQRLKDLFLKSHRERHDKKRVWKLLQKFWEAQHHEICRQLIQTMSWDEIALLGREGGQNLVNQKLSGFRKMLTKDTTN